MDAFTAQLAPTAAVWMGQGQCIEQYGAGEPYLPLLEALGQLCRTPDSEGLTELLCRHAPSWVLQMPGLLAPAAYEGLQQRVGDTTRDRMLRELAEAVEILTTERPVVLVLEDLHWSDVSTLDWLTYVARRRQGARLLILGTYRPVEAIVRGHPLRAITQELQRHNQCSELSLAYLSEAAVVAYLTQRLGADGWPQALAPMLHQRTNGNPFFLVTVVNEVLRQGILHEPATASELSARIEAVVGVPESLRQLIEQQIEQTSPEEQTLLEVASVAGMTFSAATLAAGREVAAGRDETAEDIEVECEALMRRGQFMAALGTESWPNGTVAARYGFTHALYQEVLYERVPESRRARLHRQIGTQLEGGYGSQTRDIGVELAMHFERGRDHQRALQYLQVAGDSALQRSAHHEAIAHLTKGLALLPTLPIRLSVPTRNSCCSLPWGWR